MLNQRQIEAHVTRNPAVLSGNPIIRGTRIAVSLVADWLDAGVSVEQILGDYPNLTRKDIEAAAAYMQLQQDRTGPVPGGPDRAENTSSTPTSLRSLKIGRYLSLRFGLDVHSLLAMGLGETPDHEVLRLARSAGRVVITLDRDVVQPFLTGGRIDQGIVC